MAIFPLVIRSWYNESSFKKFTSQTLITKDKIHLSIVIIIPTLFIFDHIFFADGRQSNQVLRNVDVNLLALGKLVQVHALVIFRPHRQTWRRGDATRLRRVSGRFSIPQWAPTSYK